MAEETVACYYACKFFIVAFVTVETMKARKEMNGRPLTQLFISHQKDIYSFNYEVFFCALHLYMSGENTEWRAKCWSHE
jgi:hypothetical protein